MLDDAFQQLIEQSNVVPFVLMDSLPRGITGFWSNGESPPPETNARDFTTYCHSVALQLGGEIVSKSKRTASPRNYFVVTLQIATKELSVLLNAHHPFLAVSEPWTEGCMYPEFIDFPSVTDEFRKFECYRILSKDELSKPIIDEVISNLPRAETEQIEYWKPTAIGEVMFNCWD